MCVCVCVCKCNVCVYVSVCAFYTCASRPLYIPPSPPSQGEIGTEREREKGKEDMGGSPPSLPPVPELGGGGGRAHCSLSAHNDIHVLLSLFGKLRNIAYSWRGREL